MKKKGYRAFLAGVLLAVLTVAGLPAAALAAESLQVELPSVEIKLEGTAPSPAEEYKIVLKANDDTCPMPAGSTNGECTLTIQGGGTEKFPDISNPGLGVYTYTVYQIAGDNDRCTYDLKVYTMKLTITNDQVVRVVKVQGAENSDDKYEKFLFVNKYSSAPGPGPGPGPTPPDDPDDPTPPDDPDDPTPPPGPTDDPDTPTPPADPDNPGDPDRPQTGDSSHLWLYICLGAVSLIVLVALFLTKRRKSDQ